jgi:hypothetical protein
MRSSAARAAALAPEGDVGKERRRIPSQPFKQPHARGQLEQVRTSFELPLADLLARARICPSRRTVTPSRSAASE